MSAHKNNPTEYSSQEIDNESFNDAYKIRENAAYGYQANTTVKSGAGTLHAIVFNGAATATNVTTIYDNTAGSGTVIGIPAATAVTTPESVIYDLAFGTGLTIVTATANGADMAVIYK